ncbi:Hypothetical protein NTJ_00557 [Nesidiocoris tenuis]|uniref:Uncharacterized protein n=1 Tax=Nesidiocoris tenuis TaxID=355587 RepID=A0ABN7AA38_9HEMI|nr:Hypothetical protein NTJ_00557 [Nesidiocoris tenuis]
MTGFLVLLFAGAAVAYQYEMPYYQRYLYPRYQTPQYSHDYPYLYDEYVPIYRRYPESYSRYWPGGLVPEYNNYPQQSAPVYPSYYRGLDINAPLNQQMLQQQQQVLQQQQQQQGALLFRTGNQPQVSSIGQVSTQENPIAGKTLEGIQQNSANPLTTFVPQQQNMEVTGRLLNGMQLGQQLVMTPVEGQQALNKIKEAQMQGIVGRDGRLLQVGPLTPGNQGIMMVTPLINGPISGIDHDQHQSAEVPTQLMMAPVKEVSRKELMETPVMGNVAMMANPSGQEQIVGMLGRKLTETPAQDMTMNQLKEGQQMANEGRQLVETPMMVQKEVTPTTMVPKM